MPTREELEEAIANLERMEPSYEVCQKIVIYNSLLDRYYNKVFGYTSNSEFMHAAEGTEWNKLLPLLDELMDCLILVNPKLYESFMEKLKQ